MFIILFSVCMYIYIGFFYLSNYSDYYFYFNLSKYLYKYFYLSTVFGYSTHLCWHYIKRWK